MPLPNLINTHSDANTVRMITLTTLRADNEAPF